MPPGSAASTPVNGEGSASSNPPGLGERRVRFRNSYVQIRTAPRALGLQAHGPQADVEVAPRLQKRDRGGARVAPAHGACLTDPSHRSSHSGLGATNHSSILRVSDFTVLDDGNHPLNGFKIAQRVVIYDDDIGKLPRLQGAQSVTLPAHERGTSSARLDNF